MFWVFDVGQGLVDEVLGGDGKPGADGVARFEALVSRLLRLGVPAAEGALVNQRHFLERLGRGHGQAQNSSFPSPVAKNPELLRDRVDLHGHGGFGDRLSRWGISVAVQDHIGLLLRPDEVGIIANARLPRLPEVFLPIKRLFLFVRDFGGAVGQDVKGRLDRHHPALGGVLVQHPVALRGIGGLVVQHPHGSPPRRQGCPLAESRMTGGSQLMCTTPPWMRFMPEERLTRWAPRIRTLPARVSVMLASPQRRAISLCDVRTSRSPSSFTSTGLGAPSRVGFAWSVWFVCCG